MKFARKFYDVYPAVCEYGHCLTITVSRLLKYCGFGNAAGLLANYGFLGAINQPKRQSDSEDSETEDYKQVENLYVFS